MSDLLLLPIVVGTPIRLVADAHDTSTAMIERSYSAHIGEVSDVAVRRGPARYRRRSGRE
jgi:hypothetical protein